MLDESETLSAFVARGLRSRDEAQRTGETFDAEVVVAGLQRKLDAARVEVVLFEIEDATRVVAVRHQPEEDSH